MQAAPRGWAPPQLAASWAVDTTALHSFWELKSANALHEQVKGFALEPPASRAALLTPGVWPRETESGSPTCRTVR